MITLAIPVSNKLLNFKAALLYLVYLVSYASLPLLPGEPGHDSLRT